MIVMCEGCETSFQVEDRLIKPTGSKVRCSKCRHVFVAYLPAALSVPEEPLILSDELPSASSAGSIAERPDIGSQIDALFANDLPVGTDASADQEPELLDVDDLLAEDSPPASALTGATPEDDLKLDLDLDLSFDEDQTAKEPSAELAGPPAASGAPELDFSPDSDPDQEAATGDMLPSLDDLGIKLDNLEQMDDQTTADAAQSAEADASGSSELELDLDLNALMAESVEDLPSESAANQAEGALPDQASDSPVESFAADDLAETQPASETELDLSDLEAMLEGNPQEGEGISGADAGIDLNLDADATAVDESEKTGDMEELDLASIMGETAAADLDGTTEGLSAEIDLALDVEDEPSSAPAVAASAQPPDDELDFSDITNILEEPTIESDKATEDAPLAIDLMPDDDQTQAAPSDLAPSTETPDGVLLDLESLLEDEAEGEAPAEQKPTQLNEELDLDFTVGAAPAMADDLEIEIEPVAEETGIERPAEPAVAADALDDPSAAATDQFTAEEVRFTAEEVSAVNAGATDVLDMGSAAAAAAMTAEAPHRSGLRNYLLIAAGVVILAIASILVPRSLGIQIPILSDLEIPFLGKIFQAEPEDTAGNLKLAPLAENLVAEFIDHPGAGRLCVVKGQVRNNYDHPRSAIRVTAKLYTKDKTLAKTATVYAGNVISNQELAGQDMAAIAARLKNSAGDNKMNVGVKPGRTIPFMAVFDQLPTNLDEYSVEVAGSTK